MRKSSWRMNHSRKSVLKSKIQTRIFRTRSSNLRKLSRRRLASAGEHYTTRSGARRKRTARSTSLCNQCDDQRGNRRERLGWKSLRGPRMSSRHSQARRNRSWLLQVLIAWWIPSRILTSKKSVSRVSKKTWTKTSNRAFSARDHLRIRTY